MKVRKFVFFLFAVLSYVQFLAFSTAAQVYEAWVARYNNGRDIATDLVIDEEGNAYVSGQSESYLGSYLTLKYGPDGRLLWERRYAGAGLGSDFTSALAVDKSGNVYVTGYTDGPGTNGIDISTIKYAPNGDTIWLRNLNSGPNSDDYAFALALDGSGSVYICGKSRILGVSASYDFLLIKYNPNGDTLWTRRYDGPGNSDDEALALALDTSGNVYVTGGSIGNQTDLDYTTIKYAPNGDVVWVRRYHTLSGQYPDEAIAVAADDSGNVYVTGKSWGFDDFDIFTIKYTPNGDSLWVRQYKGPPWGNDDYDVPFALAIDKQHNVYVTGSTWTGGPTLSDYVTIKYAPDGTLLWEELYAGGDGNSNGTDAANDLVLDTAGNVYVTGFALSTFEIEQRELDFVTIKYDSQGIAEWIKQYNGGVLDKGKVMAIDKAGNVYVTGDGGYDMSKDIITIKYSPCTDTNPRAGDANADGKVNLVDIIFKVNYVFKGGMAPAPTCSGDDNADGTVNLSDIIYQVNYIFRGGPASVTSGVCCL